MPDSGSTPTHAPRAAPMQHGADGDPGAWALRSTLPPVFDGVEVPEGEPGEELYDENGDLMV